ncbi:MAG: LptF/LptG family permease [candidate division Zixibacteria bacterium]|nr:LptF/LptG family permease [candidate division Zixibacteria bacterium]
MIKTLDLYILRKFFISLAVVSVAVTVLIIAINMVEELKDFVDNDVPAGDIAEYYLYFSGWAVKSFLPVFVFLAGLFTVGSLARNNELRAMKAGGVSLYRIAAPLIAAAVLISMAHFYYNEFIFPPANKRRVELKSFTIEKRPRSSVVNRYNLYRQVSDSVYYVIDKYNIPERIGYGIKLYRRDRNRLGEFITARSMNFKHGYWTLVDGARHVFDAAGIIEFSTFDSLTEPLIKDRPSEFERHLGKPEDMSYRELQDYITLMKRTGGPYLRELVDLKVKVTFPMTTIVVMIMCIPLAANPGRGGVAATLAVAAGLMLVYLVMFKVTKVLGANDYLPPDLAAWSVNGAFFIVGVLMNVFSER